MDVIMPSYWLRRPWRREARVRPQSAQAWWWGWARPSSPSGWAPGLAPAEASRTAVSGQTACNTGSSHHNADASHERYLEDIQRTAICKDRMYDDLYYLIFSLHLCIKNTFMNNPCINAQSRRNKKRQDKWKNTRKTEKRTLAIYESCRNY